jgi:hypothetical protein
MAKVTIWKRADGDALEHLPELLESVASIVGDDDLDANERAAFLRETFARYERFTGRIALDDIASTRGDIDKSEQGTKQMNQSNLDVGALAMFGLECAANNLRKANPALTQEQAFAKAYQDPAKS